MRFLEKGPSIPDELLKAQEDGNLVFLCGAGVSVAAGLPDFDRLTRDVLEELGTDLDDALERQIKGYEYDKIFTALESQYGRSLVHQSVFQLLQTDGDSFSGNHRSLLTLSEGQDGESQVITTNYDLLFEKAAEDEGRSLQTFQSGSFPRLAEGGDLKGLIYLHGRMNESAGQQANQNFVLSEADFGIAYLNLGYACKLLMEVIERKHLVLIGYSANDPVVRHLFMGLKNMPESGNFRIYAFGSDSSSGAVEVWKNRGVTPLIYDSSDGHEVLWESLAAWSEKSRDPSAWTERLCEIVKKGPFSSSPIERGQVATMVSNRHGAREFAGMEPRPERSWLLVLDAILRKETGLLIDSDGQVGDELFVEDFLSTDSSDPDLDIQPLGLVSNRRSQSVRLPARLQSLRSWICSHCDDPLVMWWLSGYREAGPDFLWDFGIEYERRKSNLNDGGLRVLSLLHDALRERDRGTWSFEWYGFEGLMKNHGWTSEVIREFERVTRPWLKVKRNSYQEPLQQLLSCELSPNDLLRHGLVSFEVVFPEVLPKKGEVPDECLFPLLKILSGHLEHASSLLNSIGGYFFREGTLHRPDNPNFYGHEHKLKYAHAVALLFDRLVDHDVEKAHIILSLWDDNDETLQGQLVLYALHHANELGVSFSVRRFMKLPDEVIWSSYCRRELLFALKAMWGDLDETRRTKVENRIIVGDTTYPSDEPGRDQDRHVRQAAAVLGYLQQNGCELSERASSAYEEFTSGIEGWREEWCQLSDEEFDRGAKCVITLDDPGELLELPLSSILPKAAETSGREDFAVDKAPFSGLVKQRPRRAFLALTRGGVEEARIVGFWNDLLRDYPEENDSRLRVVVAERLLRLSDTALSKLGRDLVRWFQSQTKDQLPFDEESVMMTWSRLLGRFAELPEEAFDSGMGTVFVGGKKRNQSRQSYACAINSVAGSLTELLFMIASHQAEEGKREIPKIIDSSLEQMLSFTGEGGFSVTSYLGLHSGWLHWLDAEWFSKWISPLAAETSEVREAFFNGLVYRKYPPPVELMRLLREDFLLFIDQGGASLWDDHEKRSLVQKVICLTVNPDASARAFAPAEARKFLRKLGGEDASEAIGTIREVLKWKEASWDSVAKPFFKSIWPKEKLFQTENSSRQLFNLIIDSGEHFPERLLSCLELFRPVVQSDMLLYQFEDEERHAQLLKDYPKEVLELLNRIITDKGGYQPHNLHPLLDEIVQADPSLRHCPTYKALIDRI